MKGTVSFQERLSTDVLVDGEVGDHILIAPPYIVTHEELVFLVDTLRDAINFAVESFDRSSNH
jgi:adenosylmethionine-8-amino-7-oxononanoate aminotransferase